MPFAGVTQTPAQSLDLKYMMRVHMVGGVYMCVRLCVCMVCKCMRDGANGSACMPLRLKRRI